MKGRAAKGLSGVLAGMFLALALVGCGSDSNGTPPVEPPEGTPEKITIAIQLSSQNTGQPTTTISINSPGTLRIEVTSDTRGPLSNQLVTAATTKGLLSPADGTALTDAGGVATIGLLAGTDSGAGLVTVTLEEASADLAFQIEAAPDVQSAAIEFVSATPQTIALKGTGGAGRSEASTVVFRVMDEFGSPVKGKTVTFELSTSVGGLALTNTSALTNSDGLASVVVTSGNVATTVRVKATVAIDANTTVETVSDTLVVSTGLPDQDSFSLSVSCFNPEGWAYDGEIVDVNIRAADRFNNPVPDGTQIVFTTEGGAVDPSCITQNGGCTVQWRSQAPRPSNGRVTLLATAIGEESFTDVNGNGVFDASDSLSEDLAEAYRDDNENFRYDTGLEEIADFNRDGVFTPGNGVYNGTLCSDLTVCTKELVNVRESIVLVMSGSDAFITFSRSSIDLTVVGQQTVNITVTDINGNPMPAETTIVVTTTNGVLAGSTSFVVPCTTQTRTYSVTVENEQTPNQRTSGSLTVRVTTPKGLVTESSIPVRDNPPTS